MNSFFVFTLIVAVCTAAQIHTQSALKDSDVTEHYIFKYIPETQHLIMKHRTHDTSSCYIATLTSGERMMVHTADGLKALELNILRRVESAQKVTKANIAAADLSACEIIQYYDKHIQTHLYFML